MKAHIKSPNTNSGALCMNKWAKINSQDYMIVSKAKFTELMTEQPNICCKKCIAKISINL